ncbi:hypothetical protein FTX61_01130 [Nitriliruptoraceae bacterium ZYF776]|nr:hypothetical protein [Profundirhabdus halotolerans]
MRPVRRGAADPGPRRRRPAGRRGQGARRGRGWRAGCPGRWPRWHHPSPARRGARARRRRRPDPGGSPA